MKQPFDRVLCLMFSYRSAGGHLDHRDVHLADVGIQTTQLLECTAAVHAGEQWYAFSLYDNIKHTKVIISGCCVFSFFSCKISPPGTDNLVNIVFEKEKYDDMISAYHAVPGKIRLWC